MLFWCLFLISATIIPWAATPTSKAHLLYKDIIRLHQLETIGHEIECSLSSIKIFGSEYFDLTCADDSYQPPSPYQAVEMIERIPNHQELYQKKMTLKKYSEAISPEMQRLYVLLWNKISPTPYTWKQIIEQLLE